MTPRSDAEAINSFHKVRGAKMQDSQKDEKMVSRRQTLKSLVAGGGVVAAGKIGSETWSKPVVESWSKPVVNSVMLPAHANTSPPIIEVLPSSGASSSAPGIVMIDINRDTLLSGILETAVPSANAGDDQGPIYKAYLCVTPNSVGTVADVEVVLEQGFGPSCFTRDSYTATNVPVDGSTEVALTFVQSGCSRGAILDKLNPIQQAHAALVGHTIVLDSATGGAMGSVRVHGGFPTLPFDIPPGACSLPVLACCD